MSDILASMVTYLGTNAALTALVSTRIYPVQLPEPSTSSPNTLPALTYQMIDEPVSTSHDGRTLHKARVQVDAYAETYKGVRAAADAVQTALQGYRGSWGVFTVGSVLRKRKSDLSEPGYDVYRESQDYIISYHEEA